MFLRSALVCILIAYPMACEGVWYGCYPNPAIAIKGCTCTHLWVAIDYAYKTTVTCAGAVGTVSDFKDNLRKLDGYGVDDFIIRVYPNTQLPDEPFTDTTEIKRIIIQNSPKLEGFGSKGGKGFFTNLGKSLKGLVIDNNPGIRSDEWVRIAPELGAGHPLAIQGNPDPVVVEGAGDFVLNNVAITMQKLFDNLDVFKTLTTLDTIILRNCGFTNFRYDLTTYVNLKLLDLSQTMSLTVFEIQGEIPPSLKTIIISYTGIEKFESTTWTLLLKANLTVDLRGNNLYCHCDSLPDNFVKPDNADNEKQFPGAKCGYPPETRGKNFGSFCVKS